MPRTTFNHKNPLMVCTAILATAFALPRIAASAEAEKEDTLHLAMEGLQSATRKLNRQIKDPTKNASSLELVVEMQKHVMNAKGATPDTTAKQPADQRAAYLSDYRKRMVKLLGTLLDVEAALIDGSNEQASTHLESALEQRFQGHKIFKVEE